MATDTPPGSLAGLVARSAARSPERPAVEDGDVTLTYAELLDAAQRLADELGVAGVEEECVVALDLVPSARTVVAMIAAGLRGAAFMPLDPREPLTRREAMMAVACPTSVVTAAAVEALTDGARLDQRSTPRRGLAAYVSFTSGSTGLPKAVVTEQPAVVNYLEQAVITYDLRPHDRQLQFSSIAFDIAIDEVFSTLAAGGTLVLRGPGFVFGGAEEFLARCAERDITVLNLPTGVWNLLGAELAERPDLRLPPGLRLVVVGGEAAAVAAVESWHAAATDPAFRVVNAYGPTEAAVSVTFADLRPDAPVTIGRPIVGVSIRILDGQGRSVTDGETGELVVGGIAVARGYLGHQSPAFAELDGEWSYRTGDVARLGTSGDLELLGRADRQVKVRGGYRVEPGEVAQALLAEEEVADVHVAPYDRRGAKVLVAFVVLRNRHDGESSARLRSRLADVLPDWMVPWQVLAVDELPLTPRGKVDETALLAAVVDPASRTVPSGRGDAHQVHDVVVRAWATSLGEAPADDDESFFEAGGDSLAALELLEIVFAELGTAPPMADLYRGPTVREICAGILASLAADVAAGAADGVAIPTAHHTTGRTLVRLRRKGGDRLWCFLPPLSGAVTRYAAMARLLPEGDAVWAMETPASLSDGGMDRLAAGLAQRLVEEDLTPFHTVVLSGYSLGGVFAHEVGRHLDAALAGGLDAPLVMPMLLDPPDPAEPQMSLADAFDIFVRVGWRIPERVDSFVDSTGERNLVAVAAAARRAGTLPASADDREVSEAWLVYASNARILDDYDLSEGLATTRLLQCREDVDIPVGTWASGEHSGSWAAVVKPGATSIVAVEHFALMEPPHDETVVRWLVDGVTTASRTRHHRLTSSRL